MASDVARAPGALPEVLGVHLEGPYLNPLRRGAHRAQDLRHPSVPEVAETLRRARGAVRVVTLAPELEGAEAVVRFLVAERVVAAAGHTDAGYDEVREAAQWGVRLVTHVFNAMRGLHHREPGAAGAALLTRGLTVSVIADRIHVHPAVLRLIARTAGTGRIALVTDAVAAAGMERGSFTLGGRDDRGAGRRAAAAGRHARGQRAAAGPGGAQLRRRRGGQLPRGGAGGDADSRRGCSASSAKGASPSAATRISWCSTGRTVSR